MYKKLLFLLALPLAAQPVLTVTPSTTTAKPGDTVVLTYSLGGQPLPLALTAFQFDRADGGKTTVGLRTLTTPGASGKSFQCSAANRCVVYGLNSLTIPNGSVLTEPITILPSATGSVIIHLSGVIASDGTGSAVTLTFGPDVTITLPTVINKFDLNGDGAVNMPDVTLMLNQILGTCTNGDLNADGKCTIVDLQLLINAAIQANPNFGH